MTAHGIKVVGCGEVTIIILYNCNHTNQVLKCVFCLFLKFGHVILVRVLILNF